MEKKKDRASAHLSDDKLTIEYDLGDFKDSLPNLSEEIFANKSKSEVTISGIRHESVPEDPEAIDFIQRCKTDDEARQIIQYLLGKKEITKEEAKKLLLQLEKEGVRSFGPLKTYGFYERNYRNR